ncbi:MAG: hypothetical protein EOP84_31130 [Verrucomicrobiaceae bacterium]|nr:MAG: hypothetical protein EOP84_31130 [Verrucomicrobiaceae bacterium]
MDRDRRPAPWFSWISAICLLCLPFCFLGAPLTRYYKGPLAKLTGDMLMLGAMLAPFAALFSAWLAIKRGERTEEQRRGCLIVSAGACGLVAIGAVMALVNFIRGS